MSVALSRHHFSSWMWLKRATDLLIATILLIPALPLTIIAASMILVSGERRVFFCQHRVGRFGKHFVIYKLRTMRREAPHNMSAMEMQRRHCRDVTKVGALLRKTHLDELPQLWNVIRGEMSLVGPRPIIPDECSLVARRASSGVDEFRPGITGWAQVNAPDGLCNETKLWFDCDYCAKWSYGLDLWIMILTVFWLPIAPLRRAWGQAGRK